MGRLRVGDRPAAGGADIGAFVGFIDVFSRGVDVTGLFRWRLGVVEVMFKE